MELNLKAKSSIQDMLIAACNELPGEQYSENFVAFQNETILGMKRLVIDFFSDPIHISKY